MLSYLVSGGGDRDMVATKRMIASNERMFHENMALLTEMIISLLKIQIKAGADVVQIFDSWAGFFSPYQYDGLMKKYLSEIVSELSPLRRKVIYFSIATSGIAPQIVESGVDYISADWRSRLSLVDSVSSGKAGLQGNLDPALAAESPVGALREVGRILDDISYKQDYIFNLGHGVLPNTDYRTLQETRYESIVTGPPEKPISGKSPCVSLNFLMVSLRGYLIFLWSNSSNLGYGPSYAAGWTTGPVPSVKSTFAPIASRGRSISKKTIAASTPSLMIGSSIIFTRRAGSMHISLMDFDFLASV